jgi:hypothetical protein
MGSRVVKPRFSWSLPIAEVRALAVLREWRGVEVLEAPPLVWLRAETLDDERWARCLHLPGVDRYTVIDDGRLVPAGALVPHGRLPQGAWSPLRDRVQLQLPSSSGGPRSVPAPTPITLVRSVEPAEPNWLLTSLAEWTAYVVAAPQVRLARWSFIASPDGRVVVRGTPIPPIAGTRFVEQSGIVVPAGWTPTPAVQPEIVRESLKLSPGDTAWFTVDGAWRIISRSDCVQASRSTVRLTAREVSA